MRRGWVVLVGLSAPFLVMCGTERSTASPSSTPTSSEGADADDTGLVLAVPRQLGGYADPQLSILDTLDPIKCHDVAQQLETPLPSGVESLIAASTTTCLLGRGSGPAMSVTVLPDFAPSELDSIIGLSLQEVASQGQMVLSMSTEPLDTQSDLPSASDPSAGYAVFTIGDRRGVIVRQNVQLITATWEGPAGASQRLVLTLAEVASESAVLARIAGLDIEPTLKL
jgi:hypothetical protein